MSTQICPNCRSTNLRRSRAHGVVETVLKIFNRKPFRCRDCGWRGILYSPERKGRDVSKRKSFIFAGVFLFIVIILFVLVDKRADVIENFIRQLIGNPK